MNHDRGLVGRLFGARWQPLHGAAWADDGQLRYPGVYLISYSAQNLTGQKINLDDVYYIGMSNSAGGVHARLKQFKSALEKGTGHSGGNHCFARNGNRPFSKLRTRKKFYVAALCLKCASAKASATPNDFRTMGRVAALEYQAIAHVLALGTEKKVPPLNRSAGGALIGLAEEHT